MSTSGFKQYCTFYLSGQLFGVDILSVKEVNPETNFTTICHAPQEVKGFVNIRGQIFLILDIRYILGFEPASVSESSRIVLFKPTVGESFGILVDSISDVVEVDENAVDPGHLADDAASMPGDAGDSSELVSGVCRLKQRLLVILEASSLLKRLE